MPPKKSIYRGPNAQHFQLVHRSVRDPLINDPDASQQVFKPIERANESARVKTGLTLAELEKTIDKKGMRENEGEAALYGITFDDSDYDYMAHLREIGQGGVVDSILLPAPRGSGVARGMKPGHDRPGVSSKGKGKAREEDMFIMPSSVMASEYEMSLQEVYASQQSVPPELQGLQPDMDPHLRQVLEALDDDAFIDEEGEDEEWFDELLGGGEAENPDDREEYEFREWGVPEEGESKAANESGGEGEWEDDDGTGTERGEAKEETWEDRFRAFKAAGGRHAIQHQQQAPSELDDAERSEMADTIGSLASNLGDMMVVGGKKRRGKRGPSDASGMSMSSSSLWRNSELRTLDDRFDKIEREYEMEDEDDDDFPDDDDVSIAPSYMSSASRASSLFSRAPSSPPKITRDDFESIMDDFLENYEIVGNRMRESLGGTALSGAEKLQVLRSALESGEAGDGLGKEENKKMILEIERRERSGKRVKEVKDKSPMREIGEEKEAKWDVETILSTYTNTDNHPGMIRSKTAAQTKARAAQRAAAAAAAEATEAATNGNNHNEKGNEDENETEDDSGSETERDEPKVTVTRPKGESTEDRKNRKAAVKAERSARRAEKKYHKETFGKERKRQLASHKKMVGDGRAADLSVASNRVVSLS